MRPTGFFPPWPAAALAPRASVRLESGAQVAGILTVDGEPPGEEVELIPVAAEGVAVRAVLNPRLDPPYVVRFSAVFPGEYTIGVRLPAAGAEPAASRTAPAPLLVPAAAVDVAATVRF
ncbi:MAG: hypothetical protein AB1726_15425 [Planctomycetota bacterium]